MTEQEWPTDINELIELLPELEDARYQTERQHTVLRQHYWNESLSYAGNYALIPGLKQLDDLCLFYDTRIDKFHKELNKRMQELPMAELLRRRKIQYLAKNKRLETAYEDAVRRRLRGLETKLTRSWEPAIARGEFACLERIDFQAIIQNLKEWYTFMCDPQNQRFSAHEELGRIPEYIARFEAVQDAVTAGIDHPNQLRDLAFIQATHSRLGSAMAVRELSDELLRDIVHYSRHTPTKHAPWA